MHQFNQRQVGLDCDLMVHACDGDDGRERDDGRGATPLDEPLAESEDSEEDLIPWKFRQAERYGMAAEHQAGTTSHDIVLSFARR